MIVCRVIYQVMADLDSLWSGPTWCGPALQWVVQSLVGVLWSYSLWIGPTLCGPVLQSLVYLVIVGLVQNCPGDMPGDRRAWFAGVRSYIAWSGLTVGALLG